MKQFILLLLICPAMIMITSCSENSPLEKYNCKIINTESLRTIKKTVFIETLEKLSELQLKEIATQIKKENSQYERLFIFYQMPGEDMAWATTHYNVNLKVNINEYLF